MADTQISTYVWVLDGATAGEITNATTAINAMSDDIDGMLTARTNLWFRAASSLPLVGNNRAWGYSPAGRTTQINRARSMIEQRYTILHELGHHVDRDALKGKRDSIMQDMSPAAGGSTGIGWNDGAYWIEPNEAWGDSFPRIYAPATITRSTGKQVNAGVYKRGVPPANFTAVKAIVSGGVTSPLSTTLAAAATVGATNIKVASVSGLTAGDYVEVKAAETHKVTVVGTTGSGGTGLTLETALAASYLSGDAVVETVPNGPTVPEVVDETVTADTRNGSTRSHTFTGLTSGVTGTAKMRFYDGTAWGEWSDSVAVTLGEPPGVPKNLTAIVTEGGDNNPSVEFGATINSASPGDYITGYSINVFQVIAGGQQVTKWAHEEVDIAGVATRIAITYAGDPLTWDQTYQWGIELVDPRGGRSGFRYTSFVPRRNTGAVIKYSGTDLSLNLKIDTLTPTFTLSNPTAANIDQARLRIFNDAGTTLVWDSGIVNFTSAASRNITVPATYLTWGANPRIDGAIRPTSSLDLGPYSTQYQVHINAAPGAPTPLSIRHDTAQVVGPRGTIYRALGRTDGIWVCSDDQPINVFPFVDADVGLGYTEAPERREIELRNLAGTNVGASPYVITSSITDEWTVPASVLTVETTFKARARYDDSASVRSAFSDYILEKYSEAPTLTAVTPSPGDVIVDPTPTFLGTFASSGGKDMAAQHLILTIDGDVVYDSGFVLTDTPEANVPRGVLDTGQTVDYSYSVYDTDGLYALQLGTITTDISVPDALTGLVLTVDLDLDAITATWDVTADAAFDAYNVYARTHDGQFRLITSITDPDITSVNIYAAAHNVETIVRVTQTNGLYESDPLDASATLGGEFDSTDYIVGFSLVRPDVVLSLPWAQQDTADTQTDLEVFAPPGRGEKVILDWGTTGYEASISTPTNDRELIRTLRTWKETDVVSVLKTPYGTAMYVRLTGTPVADDQFDWTKTRFSYIEVLPSAVDW